MSILALHLHVFLKLHVEGNICIGPKVLILQNKTLSFFIPLILLFKICGGFFSAAVLFFL